LEDRLSAHPELLMLVANTHLDHISAKARERGATFLLERLQNIALTHSANAVVLCGDFNASPNDAELAKVSSSPTLRLVRAVPSNVSLGTFTDWRPDTISKTIDYFFTSSAVKVHSHRIITDWDKAPTLASDHRPLIATLSIANPSPSTSSASSSFTSASSSASISASGSAPN
jgi:endonuclease/exonuclease/phosphatase family metal-dependent hydrolase